MKIDLHMHSSYSDDGELTPKEIIALSKKNNIDIISITDHNSVKGIKEAKEYGNKVGVKVISGVELDCNFEGLDLHLLGYGFDYNNSIYNKIEEDIYVQEMRLAKEKIRKIKENTDLIIDLEEVLKEANGRIVTGELIAEILIKNKDNHKSEFLKPYINNGERSDMPYVNFYWDYFSQGKIAYVPIEYITLKNAVNIIKETGGIPILAHPGNNLKNDYNIIYKLIEAGIEGIEVFSSYHNDEAIEFFKTVAEEKGLIITCGTDFHGKNKPNIKLGEFNKTIEYKSLIDNLGSKINI